MQQTATLLLMYAVLPLLILAGFADWVCHRATEIESTSGLRENALHWLMFGQMGAAIAVVVLFQINLTVLALVGLVFLAHELTVWMELRYTVARREVRPIEQVVHSFLELLPLVALALLVVVASPDWGLRLRRAPWSVGYAATMAAGVLLFNVLPLAEESWRCLRFRTRRSPGPR